MRIGIDLRALQTGHKYRGIGEVAKQTTNRILQLASEDNRELTFVFFEYDGDDPKQLLTIPSTVKYEVIKLGLQPESDKSATKTDKLRRNLKLLYGQPIDKSGTVDVFLQFDFAFGVPSNTRTVLIKHDLIPYIFWSKYFESAWVPFKNKALRSTLRTLFANHRFEQLLRRAITRSDTILAVSGSTKNDLEKLLGAKPRKVKVAHLGVDVQPAKTNDVSSITNMPTKPYLLFVGAGDARRRVDDLVAAFNNLKAEGHDIQLVLVGENFKEPEMIPNKAVRSAVIGSSYKKDILTMGYVDDTTKQKLFKNALAYVYPTRYEGFGIPVLEAMLLECPIITYKNSSIPEVAGEYAYYAKDWQSIKQRVEELLGADEGSNAAHLQAAKKHAESFTWDKTAILIYNELTISARS